MTHKQFLAWNEWLDAYLARPEDQDQLEDGGQWEGVETEEDEAVVDQVKLAQDKARWGAMMGMKGSKNGQ